MSISKELRPIIGLMLLVLILGAVVGVFQFVSNRSVLFPSEVAETKDWLIHTGKDFKVAYPSNWYLVDNPYSVEVSNYPPNQTSPAGEPFTGTRIEFTVSASYDFSYRVPHQISCNDEKRGSCSIVTINGVDFKKTVALLNDRPLPTTLPGGAPYPETFIAAELARVHISYQGVRFGSLYSAIIEADSRNHGSVLLAEQIVKTLEIAEPPTIARLADGSIDTGSWHTFSNDFGGYRIMSPSEADEHVTQESVDTFSYSNFDFSYEINSLNSIHGEVVPKDKGDTLANWPEHHADPSKIENRNIRMMGSYPALQFDTTEEVGIEWNHGLTGGLVPAGMRFIILDAGDRYFFARVPIPPIERPEYGDLYATILSTVEFYPPLPTQ